MTFSFSGGKRDQEFDSKNSFDPSNIEDIDEAVYRYFNDTLSLFCNTNEGWRKVPIIWSSAERSHQIKSNQDNRDPDGQFVYPVITIERISNSKANEDRGFWIGNIPRSQGGGSISISRRIKQDKTTNFARAGAIKKTNGGQINFKTSPRNDKVVYETLQIPMPVHIVNMYSVKIKTEYQSQMNEIITPMITYIGTINHFIVKSAKGHRYEAFLNYDIENNNNQADLGEDLRMFESTLELKVLGYIIGEGDNQTTPKVVKTENAVEISFPRENVMSGEEE